MNLRSTCAGLAAGVLVGGCAYNVFQPPDARAIENFQPAECLGLNEDLTYRAERYRDKRGPRPSGKASGFTIHDMFMFDSFPVWDGPVAYARLGIDRNARRFRIGYFSEDGTPVQQLHIDEVDVRRCDETDTTIFFVVSNGRVDDRTTVRLSRVGQAVRIDTQLDRTNWALFVPIPNYHAHEAEFLPFRRASSASPR